MSDQAADSQQMPPPTDGGHAERSVQLPPPPPPLPPQTRSELIVGLLIGMATIIALSRMDIIEVKPRRGAELLAVPSLQYQRNTKIALKLPTADPNPQASGTIPVWWDGNSSSTTHPSWMDEKNLEPDPSAATSDNRESAVSIADIEQSLTVKLNVPVGTVSKSKYCLVTEAHCNQASSRSGRSAPDISGEDTSQGDNIEFRNRRSDDAGANNADPDIILFDTKKSKQNHKNQKQTRSGDANQKSKTTENTEKKEKKTKEKGREKKKEPKSTRAPSLPPTASIVDTCVGADRRFDIIGLVSYPRSGNSWTRLLFHGATEYMDRGLATNHNMSNERLTSIEHYSRCSQSECSDLEVSKFVRDTLKVVPQPLATDPDAIDDQALTRNVYGIKTNTAVAAAPKRHCGSSFTFRARHPNFRDLVPPVLVKSHFPYILNEKSKDKEVHFMTNAVSKIVRLTRNPWDTIASRFLGTHRSHIDRWTELVKVRQGHPERTTPEFSAFLSPEIDRYLHFYQYWYNRRQSDAKRGIPTLVTRYESLCANTSNIVQRMVEFGGWELSQQAFECTMEESSCLANPEDMPEHLGVYTSAQIDMIWNRTKNTLTKLGYDFDPKNQKLSYKNPSIPMCIG